MADEIKAGDVVQVKSGGPQMTVEGVRDDSAHCVWFDPTATTVMRDKFQLAVLRKIAGSGGAAVR